MSAERLPIGVLIPTLNARRELERFLPDLQPVLELAEEVVVVDSYSEDSTLEWLQANLRHPNARFLSHPRGLYQSWNFGLQQLTSRYAYMATMGDLITAEGLRELVAVAEDLGCDAVLSPPEFFDTEGRDVEEESNWPIHRLLERCPIKSPTALEPWQVFLLATVDIPRGILGSSASNVYRTATFQRYPFPTDCGHAGDSGWAIRYAFDAKLVISPKVVSRFVIHPNETSGMSHERFRQLVASLFAHAGETAARALKQAPPGNRDGFSLVCGVPDQVRRLYECQDRYNEARRAIRPWPWILNRRAWQTRSARNAQRARVLEISERLRQSRAASSGNDLWGSGFLDLVSDCIRNVC